MDMQQLIDHCLNKNGAYADFPFGEQPLCIKVQGKLFAIFYKWKNGDMVTFKAPPDEVAFLCSVYPGAVTDGYHFPPAVRRYWLSAYFGRGIPDSELLAMADTSYREVVSKLPRALREELEKTSGAR